MSKLIEEYDRLGWKTYLMILLPNAIILIAALVLIIVGSRSTELIHLQIVITPTLLSAAILAGILFTILIATLATIEYLHYSIYLSTDDVRLRRGILEISDTSIPYKSITDVQVYQSLTDRILGIANVIITAPVDSKRSKIILGILDKKIAYTIQREIAERTQTSKIAVVSEPKK